jgi:hypothetical protein
MLVARGSGGPVGSVVSDVPHFVMEQKMLRGESVAGPKRARGAAVLSIGNPYSHADGAA